ncbi:MAG TPA: pilus assembly protein TadG-related protein [Hyphomonadaceae bacterium]|nr:pilus assembly protein TadG-related protein [Hyphomonadaceae bacterium]
MSFWSNRHGNIALMALGFVAISVFVGGGIIDYMSLRNQQGALQDVADRAAIAAAQELVVFKGSEGRVDSVAQTFVDANYKREHQADAEIVNEGKGVKVTITSKPQTYFPGPIARGVTEVKAEATAEVAGGGYVCMIGLDENAPSTLQMDDKARVTATDCAIYSNSKNAASLNLHSLARVKADLVCVAGGVAGPTSAVTPNAPVTDCPPLVDPLRDRPQPHPGLLTCNNIAGGILGKDILGKDGKLLDLGGLLGSLLSPNKKSVLGAVLSGDIVGNLAPGLIVTGNQEIEPGVYCGGLNVIGGHLKLKPGTYVMNNGGINVANGGSIEGEGVGFFLTGVLGLSTVQFAPSSTISLTAPRTGDMAGMLFFEDRNVLFKFPHIIASNDARKLVGTIYLPGNTLQINSQNPIADQSDYTVIIAKKFEMKDGPELVLNTDYEHSLVPVPEGVGNKARPSVHLTK